MSESIKAADHTQVMYRLAGWYPKDGQVFPQPSHWKCGQAASTWNSAGELAGSIADDLKTGLDRLISDKGWHGKAAEEFKKKVEQIIWYAREIAHTCDSDFEKPKPPKGDAGDNSGDDGPFQRDTTSSEGSGTKSYKQNFEDLKGFLKGVEDNKDEKLPPPPWWEEGSNWWVKWYTDDYLNGDIMYEIRNDGKGKRTGVIKGGIPPDEMESNFSAWNVNTEKDWDGVYAGQKCKTAEDSEKVFYGYKMNKDEKKTAQETAGSFATKYQEVSKAFPKFAEAPKISVDDADGGAGGAGGGIGGGGAGGGIGGGSGGGGTPPFPDRSGPSGPETPDGPKGPDAPEGPNRPDGPETPDGPDGPTPKNPGPRAPDDFPGPDERDRPDGPKGPDTPNPTPDGPSPGPNGPRGPVHVPDEHWDPDDPPVDDSDLGGDSELSRTGPGAGGPGAGGGAGGPGSNISTGGPGGGAGAGGAGSGLGSAGGLTAGGGSGGGLGGARAGGMGGMGMMPMMGAPGAGMGGVGDGDRNTWLDEETDDVWGVGDDGDELILGGGSL